MTNEELKDNPIMQFFLYQHLSEELQKISKPFCDLALELAWTLDNNAESITALRKLLEAKDCAVRSYLSKR